jgi:voltage-gated sodium channel
MQQWASRLVASTFFQRFIIAAIVVSAILVGLETSQSLVSRWGQVFHVLDRIIVWIFTLEIVIKLIGAGQKRLQWFRDPWNLFDTLIVVLCWVPAQTQFGMVLRLVRILRILKLITALPRLQLIVGALLKSVPSIGWVGMLLGIHFYIFAVMGVFLFGTNDPFRFGDLPSALLTLFQIATMENWVELMNANKYGCDQFGYEGPLEALCISPLPRPIVAPLYWIVFIVLGTMIILNLFIGIIMKGMEEMESEMAREEKHPTELHQVLDALRRIEAKLDEKRLS